MAAAAAATGVFAVGFSPLLRGKKSPATRKYNKPKSTVTNSQSVWSTERPPRPPSTTVSEKGSLQKAFADEAKLEGEGEQRLKLKDYFEQSKEMMIGSDGGPPRWFSPLDCASRLGTNSPLLLYLPGVDGVGLGLSLHHKRLGEMFDIWCLHIPVMDRTPFSDLVDLVTNTVRSENFCSPNRPIYLVGESIGACLALSVAACNPDIDLILILANPATCFGRSQLQPFMPLLQIMPEPLNRGLPYALSFATGIPLKMVMSILDKRYPLDQTVGELTESVGAFSSYLSVLADILPRETLYWKLQMLRSASGYANSRLHAVKAQTLILSSGRDLLLPSQEEGERLCHMLPKCEIRKFDDSGHALFLDNLYPDLPMRHCLQSPNLGQGSFHSHDLSGAKNVQSEHNFKEDDLDLVTVIQGAGFYRRARCIDYSSDYIPPTPSEFKKIYEPFRWIEVATNPVVLSTLEDGKIVRGLAGVPSEGPVLFVGYHMLLGWDLVPLISRFWMERNIVVRGIAHPMMFTKLREGSLPELSAYDTFRKMGAVPVSATNFYRLFASKSHVLLFPGGMREALHRKGEEYKLFWPEQSEFVRMAARFGATIIPFGTVGEDDVAEVLLDYDDLMKIPYFKAEIAKLTDEAIKLRADINGEVANQDVHLPVILPKLPGRFYYYFGRPIETKGRKKELRDKEKAHELYLEVKSEVEKCIGFLKEKRKGDPYRHILPRLIFQAMHGFGLEVPTFEL